MQIRLLSPIKEFIGDSRAVGILLVVCTVLSILVTNTAGPGYAAFWDKALVLPEGLGLHAPHTILHWINDGLMALFFLLVGLEIKRELMRGELSSFSKATLPVAAALGGMVVPAAIYSLLCAGTPYSHGWAIPMATDIAFSLGILSLLGRRAPTGLKVFLTALAIIDDLGGILAIAIFYAGDLQWTYLLIAGGVFLLMILLNVLKVKRYVFYFIPGLVLWYCVLNGGIHPTIAGVLTAFTIRLPNIERLEHALHDGVSFLILPLFALANTAILLPSDFSQVLQSPLTAGIFFGLLLGKPLGIVGASVLAVRLGLSSLPTGVRLRQLIGGGLVAGIGFTMSIFMAMLAFSDTETQTVAKVGIIAASVVSGILGCMVLLPRGRHRRVPPAKAFQPGKQK